MKKETGLWISLTLRCAVLMAGICAGGFVARFLSNQFERNPLLAYLVVGALCASLLIREFLVSARQNTKEDEKHDCE